MVLGVAETLPFKRQSFDLVLIVASLSLFKDPVQALREAAGVLKPGGQIVIGILDRDSLHGDFYESRKKRVGFLQRLNFSQPQKCRDGLQVSGSKKLKSARHSICSLKK